MRTIGATKRNRVLPVHNSVILTYIILTGPLMYYPLTNITTHVNFFFHICILSTKYLKFNIFCYIFYIVTHLSCAQALNFFFKRTIFITLYFDIKYFLSRKRCQ